MKALATDNPMNWMVPALLNNKVTKCWTMDARYKMKEEIEKAIKEIKIGSGSFLTRNRQYLIVATKGKTLFGICDCAKCVDSPNFPLMVLSQETIGNHHRDQQDGSSSA